MEKRDAVDRKQKCLHATSYVLEYYPKLGEHVVKKCFSENCIHIIMLVLKRA